MIVHGSRYRALQVVPLTATHGPQLQSALGRRNATSRVGGGTRPYVPRTVGRPSVATYVGKTATCR